MISIVGCDEGPEADAAREIKQSIFKAWPWIENDSDFCIPVCVSNMSLIVRNGDWKEM